MSWVRVVSDKYKRAWCQLCLPKPGRKAGSKGIKAPGRNFVHFTTFTRYRIATCKAKAHNALQFTANSNAYLITRFSTSYDGNRTFVCLFFQNPFARNAHTTTPLVAVDPTADRQHSSCLSSASVLPPTSLPKATRAYHPAGRNASPSYQRAALRHIQYNHQKSSYTPSVTMQAIRTLRGVAHARAAPPPASASDQLAEETTSQHQHKSIYTTTTTTTTTSNAAAANNNHNSSTALVRIQNLAKLRRLSPPATPAPPPTPPPTLVQDGSYLQALGLKLNEATSRALAPVFGTGNDCLKGRRPLPPGRGKALGALISRYVLLLLPFFTPCYGMVRHGTIEWATGTLFG